MKKITSSLAAIILMAIGCNIANAQEKANDIWEKINQYASYTLKADIDELSHKERDLLSIFIEISKVMDEIFWEQSFGKDNRARLWEIEDPNIVKFANIQYGAWDRLDANKPFIPGFGEKPAGANFYPSNMTKEEFNKIKDPQKSSPYTILRRNTKGGIDVIPYHIAYEKQLKRVDKLLEKAIEMAENDGLRKYLETRRKALITDDYEESDMVWMDMKDSRLDFVFGPIENYEDALFGYKTAYEAFVLVKDMEWSDRLNRLVNMLPDLQQMLPCDPMYKTEIPGTESDINVYDVVYYAGDCNAGSKTIAINLPNDENVQLKKGTRRLQLKNAMQAKYDNILVPIANLLICKDQIENVKFDAFFNNVCNHEVAHGLGIKNTVTDKGTVRKALRNQYSAWEEAKADICGLFIVQTLIERGELNDITIEDAYVTYLASLLRSVRFGATEAHGIANIMCFNFMMDHKAFSRDSDGRYRVNTKAMRKAIEEWAAIVIKTEGDGDYTAAKTYAEKNGVVRPMLAKDLKTIEKANIPIDIRYEQGHHVLGLEKVHEESEPTMVKPNKNVLPSNETIRPAGR